jgi:hypothetical protein
MLDSSCTALHMGARNFSGLGVLGQTENTAVWIREADHVAPSIRKSWH